MYVYIVDGVALITNMRPNSPFLEINELPKGEGKLCTDLKTVWYEPLPEKEPPQVPIEAKFNAQQERLEFLEDCIAEMAQIIYSD